MRPITKTLSLATKYNEWLKTLDPDDHPEYESSTGFYYDIVANLLYVQDGLCAYTETYLISKDRVAPDNWKEGRYGKLQTLGQLDHFDPRLKEKNGWLWDNFFMIHSDINTKVKREHIIHLLKPDSDGFDPYYYLGYNIDMGVFFPNNERTEEEKQLILMDLKHLGINHPSIRDMRKDKLARFLVRLEFGDITVEQGKEELLEFFTAYEMSAQYILGKK